MIYLILYNIHDCLRLKNRFSSSLSNPLNQIKKKWWMKNKFEHVEPVFVSYLLKTWRSSK